jgi:Alpha galactosidase A
MRKTADALISTGLAALGYKYVNMDDCWQVDRHENGTIIPDPTKFPDGIKATADYVHSLGLYFGLYTAQREFTCQERPGSWRFESIDIDTYCAAGIDYVKTDACGGRGWPQDNTTWILFRTGITKCVASGGRDMVLSVESCSDASCGAWIPKLANLWRTTGDIQATFASVLSNLDNNNKMVCFH